MNPLHDSQEVPDRDQAQPSRRKFIRDAGGILFTVTVVDALSTAALAAGTTCGKGTPDGTCDSKDPDSNCGYTTNGPGSAIDADSSCSATSNDESCGKIAGDDDQSCNPGPGTSYNQDGNCNKPDPNNLTDPDGSCSQTTSDASCATRSSADEGCRPGDPDANCQNKSGTYDQDASCTTKGGTADGACGNGSGTVDIDAHCGYPAQDGSNDADASCNMNPPGLFNKHTDQTNVIH